MFAEKELALLLIDTVPEDVYATFTKLQSVMYLMNNRIKERYGNGTKYEFNSFSCLRGPYDEELKDDFFVWCTVGLIHTKRKGFYFPENDFRLTNHGRSFMYTAKDRLIKSVGTKKEFIQFKKMISEYTSKTDDSLIEEAVREWSKCHTDKTDEIKVFFPFIASK